MSGRPKYLAIADAIQSYVRQGRLQPGSRLPPHRELADELGVTVGTVTRGYAEAERRGLTRGEVGRGTYIASADDAEGFLNVQDQVTSDFVDLGLVFPFYSEDPDLGIAMARMSKRKGIQALLRYHRARGMHSHRVAGVKWLHKLGLEISVEEVLVCSGGQHALTVLLAALFKPKERLLVEELTYPAIKPLASMFQLRLTPLKMDRHGIAPEALEAACAKSDVKGLYTIPSLQNPTTATMPEDRRQEISSICRKHDLRIIEDDCYAMTLDSPPLPMFTYAPERTFFVGSLSKTVAAGLRVAFLAVPREYAAHVESTLTHTVWMTSPILSELAAMWIEEGTAEIVLEKKRAEARKRNLLAQNVLKELQYRGKPTGYYIWLELPEALTPIALREEAMSRQVALVNPDQFVMGNLLASNGIRLSLSAAPTRQLLEKGLKEVADIVRGGPRPDRIVF
jgi:DNA-binding transcriptional MocR family regulator